MPQYNVLFLLILAFFKNYRVIRILKYKRNLYFTGLGSDEESIMPAYRAYSFQNILNACIMGKKIATGN